MQDAGKQCRWRAMAWKGLTYINLSSAKNLYTPGHHNKVCAILKKFSCKIRPAHVPRRQDDEQPSTQPPHLFSSRPAWPMSKNSSLIQLKMWRNFAVARVSNSLQLPSRKWPIQQARDDRRRTMPKNSLVLSSAGGGVALSRSDVP